MKKTILFLLLCVAMAFAAGCGGEDYPALAVVPLDGLDLEEGGSDSLSAQFPAGEWVFDLSMGAADFFIYDLESLESDTGTTNINAAISGSYSGKLEQAVLDELLKEFDSMGETGMEIQSAEMRSLDGEPVIYMETVTRITEEMLELTIQSGAFTEEQISAMGGREALLSAPPTYQIQLYGVVEDKLLILTGSYYDEADKDRLLETMTIVLVTADVK